MRLRALLLGAVVLASFGVVLLRAAKVQLLLDHESGLGVRIERSRITAVVSGQAGFADQVGNLLAMNFVPVLADVVGGDVVVTSGLDRMFPKGLMVGRVQSVKTTGGLFKDILAIRQWIRRKIWPRLPGRPLWRFLYMFFFRFGFMDGLPGLQLALLMACYEYMIGRLYKEKLGALSGRNAPGSGTSGGNPG